MRPGKPKFDFGAVRFRKRTRHWDDKLPTRLRGVTVIGFNRSTGAAWVINEKPERLFDLGPLKYEVITFWVGPPLSRLQMDHLDVLVEPFTDHLAVIK